MKKPSSLIRGKSFVRVVTQQKKQVAKQSCILWIQILFFFLPFNTISKKTPAKPLVKEQMTIQMKPRRGFCSVVIVLAVAPLLLNSTKPTPGTIIIRATTINYN